MGLCSKLPASSSSEDFLHYVLSLNLAVIVPLKISEPAHNKNIILYRRCVKACLVVTELLIQCSNWVFSLNLLLHFHCFLLVDTAVIDDKQCFYPTILGWASCKCRWNNSRFSNLWSNVAHKIHKSVQFRLLGRWCWAMSPNATTSALKLVWTPAKFKAVSDPSRIPLDWNTLCKMLL